MKIYFSYNSIPELKDFPPEDAKKLYVRYHYKTLFYGKRLIGMGIFIFSIILWGLLLSNLPPQWGMNISPIGKYILLILFATSGAYFYNILSIETIRSVLRRDLNRPSEKSMD